MILSFSSNLDSVNMITDRISKRMYTESAKTIIGGVFAALTFQGVSLLGTTAWYVNFALGGVFLIAMVFFTALSFEIVEDSTPPREVRLTDEQFQQIMGEVEEVKE